MILCCGEALIDMLPRQSVDGDDAFVPFPGGAVFNTALALGRLGVSAGFFGGLSTDFFGDRIRQALNGAGTDCSLCPTSTRPTTLAFVQLQDGQASYIFRDENSALRMMTVDDLPKIPAGVTALFFGGISLTSGPCGHAFETLMTQHSGQRSIVFDPNIRPDFVIDQAAYRARLERMITLSDIVKFSEEDLLWLCGDASHATARKILKTGPCAVIVTSGDAGARLFRNAGRIEVPARKVRVVDTVGAGDTFNAGLMAWLSQADLLGDRSALADLEEQHWKTALDYATCAASISVSRVGADPPWIGEM